LNELKWGEKSIVLQDLERSFVNRWKTTCSPLTRV